MGEFQRRISPLQTEECIAGMNKQAETPAGNLHVAAAPGIRMNGNRLNKPSGPGPRFSPPLAWFFLIFCATLLVGCGGKAASGHSGHGWFFILAFYALALFGFLRISGKGMTTGKFLGWLIMAFVLWKGMNWTVEGSGWLLHRMGDAKEWVVGLAKPDANEPQPAATPAKVVEKPRSSREPESPLSADTRRPFGKPDLATRPSRTAGNKSDNDFGTPNIPTEAKGPPPGEPSTFKTTGGETMSLLQKARDPLPSQVDELEFLEKRMGEIEVSLLTGLKKATEGKQPVEDLKYMVEDLKMVTSNLKLPEKCQFKKSVEALRQQLDKKSSEFDDKIKKGQTGKNVYMEMFTEIKKMKIRVDTLGARFDALKPQSDALAQEAAGWIDLYNDTVGFKGEAAAREGLTNQLLEKEKSLAQEH